MRLYHVLLDRFKEYKEATVKNCKALKYSNGCQYWAGASGMTVVIYDSSSFTQLMAFQGHMMAIRRLVWAPGDQVLRSRFPMYNLNSSFFMILLYFVFLVFIVPIISYRLSFSIAICRTLSYHTISYSILSYPILPYPFVLYPILS